MRATAPLLLLLVLVLTACKGSTSPADATYTTRGKVIAVGKQLEIHHEEIPEYTSRTGKQTGMMSMTMAFDVASTVSIAGLEPGAKVSLTFEVRFKGDPALRITALTVLPPETTLVLPAM